MVVRTVFTDHHINKLSKLEPDNQLRAMEHSPDCVHLLVPHVPRLTLVLGDSLDASRLDTACKQFGKEGAEAAIALDEDSLWRDFSFCQMPVFHRDALLPVVGQVRSSRSTGHPEG